MDLECLAKEQKRNREKSRWIVLVAAIVRKFAKIDASIQQREFSDSPRIDRTLARRGNEPTGKHLNQKKHTRK